MTPDLEVRRRFVRKFVPLSLWYVRRQLARGLCRESDLPKVLTSRVDLYRLTSLYDGTHDPASGWRDPQWTSLADQLSAMIRQSPAGDTEGLESRGLELLWPLLEKRLPKDVGVPPERPFGCWNYQMAWKGTGDRPGMFGKLLNFPHVVAWARAKLGLPMAPRREVALHFDNVLKPRSPFDDLASLAGSLRRLVADCRAKHPAAEVLWFHSWLNGHPDCRRLFPPGFAGTAINRGVTHYQTWWGQFMTKTGDFNDEIARRFRKADGEFPYPGVLCHGRIDEIDAHLAALIPQLGNECETAR
ncbi:MAG: hypothetical protein ACREU9_08225 [Gammaproteobacteria bacterium]